MKKFVEGIDYFFNKMLPKKLIVVALATWVVLSKIEAPNEYYYILMSYMGVNIAGKFASVIGKKKDE